jgi:predicted nucleotidyltransferase
MPNYENISKHETMQRVQNHKLQLEGQNIQLICQLIAAYTKNFKFAIFGSRVKNTNKQYSDVDILILDDKQNMLDKVSFMKLKLALVESDLPYIVDLLTRSRISSDFYDKIKNDLVIFDSQIK